MSDLIERARIFATQAHQRIDQRRKYNGQPYHVHLEAVARLLSTVTDDAEVIAAAWLHDVVEDTPATLGDVEREFGASVARLVRELTDVSRPGDGNRAARKTLDREHMAAASPRAKTVKLADLIDNCADIVHHDPRFARVYLQEMEALLDVLGDAHQGLLEQARALHARSMEQLRSARPPAAPAAAPLGPVDLLPQLSSPRIARIFREAFAARDIADPLLSFDATRPCSEVAAALEGHAGNVAGVRRRGAVQACVLTAEIAAGGSTPCGERSRAIAPDQVLDGDAPLIDVVGVLTRHDHCFVTAFDSVSGIVTREAVNKPVVRMWLFGAITLYEMNLVRLVRKLFPDGSWQGHVPAARLEKARELQRERERRNQRCELIDCLQLTDKAQIMLDYPPTLEALGLPSKRVGKQLVKELESLRNHLAHAQDIAAHNWVQIIRITQRLDEYTS